MRLRVPEEVFGDIEELIPLYLKVREGALHGSLDNGGTILSWDANGNVYLESDLLEVQMK